MRPEPQTGNSLVRNGPFRRYYLGVVISSTGSVVAPIALAFAVLAETPSPGALGLVLTAQVLPNVVLLLLGGAAADRWSRSRIMATANAVAFLAQAAIAALLFSGRYETWAVAVLAAVNGAASAFYRPSADSILPQLVGPDLLLRANSVVRVSFSVSRLVGPAIGGVLVALVGARYLLAWDAVTFLIAAALLAGVRVSPVKGVFATSRGALRAGWRRFVTTRWLWTCTAQMAVGGMAWIAGFQLMGPVIADRRYGGSAFWGLVVSSYAAGLLLGGLLMLAWRPRRLLVAANLCSLTLALPLVGYAAGWPVAAVLGAAVLAGGGTEVAMITWITARQRHIPVAELGRISAYDNVGAIVLAPLAYPVAGLLAAAYGPAPVVYTSAALLVATSLLILLVPDVRRLGVQHPTGQQG
jgi:MFS family permease